LLVDHLLLLQIGIVSNFLIRVLQFVVGQHLVVLFGHFDAIIEVSQEDNLTILILFY
jgi:hypothetical protein